MEDTTQYNTEDFQSTLINFMISDETSFTRVANIVDDKYFMDHLRPVVRMIKDHASKYSTVPQPQQVKAMTGYAPEMFQGVADDPSMVDWFLNSTEGFCRHRAIENIIYAGPEMIAKGLGGDLERQIKDAMQISLISDLGSNYFEDVRARLERMKDRSNYITTGWRSMDRKLGGGFTRGSLNIFAGGSGCVIAGTKIRIMRDGVISAVAIETLSDVNDGAIVFADSPDGYVPVEQWRNKGIKECYSLMLSNGASITASHDHLFQKPDQEWIYTRDIKLGETLLTDSGETDIVSIDAVGNQTVYDLAIDHENHRYYTNGICSHNSGKSIFLQNIALNWAMMGLNVIYISLELSEDLVNNRLDAMVTQFRTSELLKNIDTVCLKVANARRGKAGQKAGDLMVKKFNEAGTTSNDIKAYLKEYQIKTGRKPDAVVIDYLDLMHPNNSKIDINQAFNKDKYVSEEMRAIGGELDIPVVSASQLNRASVEASEFDHSHIAGGISKINTADNVFGIFTSLTMRENGKYQIQFLKTRSASAVGHKLDLAYDASCMRLSDMPDDDEDDAPVMDNKQTVQTASGIANTPSHANPILSPSPSPANAMRSDLQNLLGKLKKDI